MIASVTGMLDLQPRVHLHEAEAVGPQPLAAVGDELDRAGADIADGPRRLDRGLAHGGAHLRRHAGRRRLLDHLLMPPLERAVALEEMHDIAVPVGEDLDLDVARREHVFLDEHARVAEGAQPPRAARSRAPPRTRPRSSTRRMPLPPPPATALISTG